jgi:hypothetical protein
MLPHLLPPMLSADWMSNSTRVGRGRRVAKQLIVCCRDQKKNGRNWSINKATKNRQSSATAKRRAGAKGLNLKKIFSATCFFRNTFIKVNWTNLEVSGKYIIQITQIQTKLTQLMF